MGNGKKFQSKHLSAEPFISIHYNEDPGMSLYNVDILQIKRVGLIQLCF